MPTDDLSAPGHTTEHLGRYRLLEKLGEGGMGAVYLAHDTKLDRRVAVKLLPEQSVHDADAVARFRREAVALARLSHPGIVQAHDSDCAEGRHFLVMEYVEGVSLAQLLRERGRVPPTLAADYVYQAARALQHAHERGLIHRDLKPSNLLVTPRHEVKILDLGLARFQQDHVGDATLTRDGAGMGTPDYAPPEQFLNARHADVRSDIYSLGCTLYHLLTGRPPFPGSSLSEKARAHAEREPDPLVGLCPEVPAGLALVVARMMAKRPADRFPSAAALAEALAPYVAGASPAFAALRESASWSGGQLTLSDLPGRRSRKRWLLRAAGALAAASLLGAVLLLLWRPWDKPDRADQPDQARTAPEITKKAGPVQTAAAPAGDVLTVSQDGRGKYRTVAEALAAVRRPGTTIRILDDATYPEAVAITLRRVHKGLTLEAVGKATLAAPDEAQFAVRVEGVPNVTVRGLRVRAGRKALAAAAVLHDSPGVVLEGLTVLSPPRATPRFAGIGLSNLSGGLHEGPVVVRNCEIQPGCAAGILVWGATAAGQPALCRRARVEGNRISGCRTGVLIMGQVRQLHVTGNAIWDSERAGVQLEHILDGSADLLIANNTILLGLAGLAVRDSAVKARDVRVCNNLLLGARSVDMLFLDSGGESSTDRGPGDGAEVARKWALDHNWREGKPAEGDPLARGRIPPAAADVNLAKVEVRSRVPGRPDFLQPPARSALAREGAGLKDPSLPVYAGAVPPEGAEPWDWRWTWEMRVERRLTVSRDRKGGGRFRTIAAALDAARPDTTVRVLDDGVYPEPLVLDSAEQHAGLVLEAPRKATIGLKPGVSRALVIKDVPGVRVRGFKFREPADGPAPEPNDRCGFIYVVGECPGAVVEELDIEGHRDGILLQHVRVPAGEAPVVVRRCTIRLSGKRVLDAIGVLGPGNGDDSQGPCRGVCVRDNHITGGMRGVILQGALRDIHVTGNVLADCATSGLHFVDLVGQPRGVLLANNTAYGGNSGLRLVDNPPYLDPKAGGVEASNNLLFDLRYADVSYFRGPQNANGFEEVDASALAKLMRFRKNYRDRSGSSRLTMPLLPEEGRFKPAYLVTRDPADPNFLRPRPDSPLARDGAGAEDPSLPRYVGALPPPGERAWDWERTWRARVAER